MLTKTYLNRLELELMGACIEAHKVLGPGLPESVYQKCLCREFFFRGNFSSQ